MASPIDSPMLAETILDKNTIKYPCLATKKLDGLRCLVRDGIAVSRKFKNIPNRYIKKELEASLGSEISKTFDGEIFSGTTFQECSGNVMRFTGEPNFEYFVFDIVSDDLTETYQERMKKLEAYPISDPRIKKLLPTLINNKTELDAFEAKCLAEGYEGVIIRSLDGPYKCGRSTLREGYLLKLKKFSDSEAEVIGFEELQRNKNVAVKNKIGRSERSTAKANMVNANTLGALLVRDVVTKIEFKIGSGFDDTTRDAIWADRANWLGKIVKYKHFEQGVKDAPRFPTFLGERSLDDM